MLPALLLLIAVMTPNEELTVCASELRDIAEGIRYSIFTCPTRKNLFHVDGHDVDVILDTLATRLQENLPDCPCTGPCSYAKDNCVAPEIFDP